MKKSEKGPWILERNGLKLDGFKPFWENFDLPNVPKNDSQFDEHFVPTGWKKTPTKEKKML